MSYEMKNILKIMIDNNEPHWSADTMDMARKELDRVYAQASKADEYEAKAKAFDGVKELINAHDFAIEEESGLGHLFLLDLKSIMKYAESGEQDA